MLTYRSVVTSIAVFLIFLIGCSTLVLEAEAATMELAYDDGSAENPVLGASGFIFAVKFSLPTDWTIVKILTARFWIYNNPVNSFMVHVLDSDKTTALLTPPLTVTPNSTGWFDVDLSAYNIVVTGDFYIVFEFITLDRPGLGADTGPAASSRSYFSSSLPPPWTKLTTIDCMIRAIVEDQSPQPAPVGGVVSPVKKLEIVIPYLALAGLIATVSTVYVIRRRKD